MKFWNPDIAVPLPEGPCKDIPYNRPDYSELVPGMELRFKSCPSRTYIVKSRINYFLVLTDWDGKGLHYTCREEYEKECFEVKCG